MSMCPGTRGWQLHHRTLTQVPGLTSRPYNSRLQRKAIQAKAMKGAASYAALANELADAAAEVIRPYFRWAQTTYRRPEWLNSTIAAVRVQLYSRH